jgi:hypothetical protein
MEKEPTLPESEETLMWLVIGKINDEDIEGARKLIDAGGITFNEEAKETLTWARVRALDDGNAELAEFIDSILK